MNCGDFLLGRPASVRLRSRMRLLAVTPNESEGPCHLKRSALDATFRETAIRIAKSQFRSSDCPRNCGPLQIGDSHCSCVVNVAD